jgi:hypothetical protein
MPFRTYALLIASVVFAAAATVLVAHLAGALGTAPLAIAAAAAALALLLRTRR